MVRGSELEALRIDAHDTHDLRERVLRPGHPEECVYPGDDDELTLHVGAFDHAGELVAIASVYREDAPSSKAADAAEASHGVAWRLRGVATEPSVRRHGAGRIMLSRIEEHVRAHDGSLMWCNARIGAIGFYATLGWKVVSDRFDIPRVGPHVVMQRSFGAS